MDNERGDRMAEGYPGEKSRHVYIGLEVGGEQGKVFEEVLRILNERRMRIFGFMVSRVMGGGDFGMPAAARFAWADGRKAIEGTLVGTGTLQADAWRTYAFAHRIIIERIGGIGGIGGVGGIGVTGNIPSEDELFDLFPFPNTIHFRKDGSGIRFLGHGVRMHMLNNCVLKLSTPYIPPGPIITIELITDGNGNWKVGVKSKKGSVRWTSPADGRRKGNKTGTENEPNMTKSNSCVSVVDGGDGEGRGDRGNRDDRVVTPEISIDVSTPPPVRIIPVPVNLPKPKGTDRISDPNSPWYGEKVMNIPDQKHLSPLSEESKNSIISALRKKVEEQTQNN